MKRGVWLLTIAVLLFGCFPIKAVSAAAVVTRADFAAALYKLADVAPSEEKSPMPFSDVDETADYAEALIWCERMCVVYGIDDSHFAPEQSLTRQEMVTMLFRFAGVMGNDTSSAIGFEGITDRELISGWAAQAVDWALASGLIAADSEGKLNPLEPVTSEEMSALLAHYDDIC